MVETPPTPFADRLLEQELTRAKREDQPPISRNATYQFSDRVDGSSQFTDRNSTFSDRHAASQLAAMFQLSDIESFIAKVTMPPPPGDDTLTTQLTSNDLKIGPQDFSGNFLNFYIYLLWTFHLSTSLRKLDFADFFANTYRNMNSEIPLKITIPLRIYEWTEYHIFVTGFIIPPPPPPRVNISPSLHGSSNNNIQSKVTHSTSAASNTKTHSSLANKPKFDASSSSAKAFGVDSSKMDSISRASFTDREIHEIKVAKETFFKEPKEKISPRIASIQKMLSNTGFGGPESSGIGVGEVLKKSSPPPPPPRQGVVPKSSTNKVFSQTSPPQKDAIKPMLPLPGKQMRETFTLLSSLPTFLMKCKFKLGPPIRWPNSSFC